MYTRESRFSADRIGCRESSAGISVRAVTVCVLLIEDIFHTERQKELEKTKKSYFKVAWQYMPSLPAY